MIEDENELRGLIARALKKEQFIVEEAADCHTAEDKLLLFEYDCVLLDIMLPDGSGLELLKRVKSEGKGTNFIIISARNSVEDKVTGLEEGADDYLPKQSDIQTRERNLNSSRRNTTFCITSCSDRGIP